MAKITYENGRAFFEAEIIRLEEFREASGVAPTLVLRSEIPDASGNVEWRDRSAGISRKSKG